MKYDDFGIALPYEAVRSFVSFSLLLIDASKSIPQKKNRSRLLNIGGKLKASQRRNIQGELLFYQRLQYMQSTVKVRAELSDNRSRFVDNY